MKRDDLYQKLQQMGRVHFAQVLQEHAEKTALEYARMLYSYETPSVLEPEFASALRAEFERLTSNTEAEAALNYFEKNRTLQTAPHLVLTQSPRMLTIAWLSSLGVPKNIPYVAGMYSGVPFSNSAWPGAINYSSRHKLSDLIQEDSPVFGRLAEAEKNREQDTSGDSRRISLIPARMQDMLVYQSKVPETLSPIVSALTEKLSPFIKDAPVGTSYSDFALKTCSEIESGILGRRVLYIDINEVIRRYLCSILTNEQHPISKLLFDEETRGKVSMTSSEPLGMFYRHYDGGKRTKQESITLAQGGLISDHGETVTRDVVLEGLTNGELCPGQFLLFTVLCHNKVRALGSFSQIEYLPAYGELWEKSGFFSKEHLSHVPLKNLTTGMILLDGESRYPVDVLLGDTWSPSENMKMEDLLEPVIEELWNKFNV